MRWQEGSPTEGCFQPACPQALTGKGGNLASNRPQVFLSLVNKWKSLFYKCDHPMCQCQPLGPTSARRSGP